MKFLVNGGRRLQGKVRISGAKNAALVLIAASVMAGDDVVLDNVPRIADVETQLQIVQALGGRFLWEGENIVRISWPEEIETRTPFHLAKKLRASNLFLGSLLARAGRAEIPLPGGCNIGSRPMDLHLKGLQALGFEVKLEHGFIKAWSKKPTGNRIYLDFPSVGATENIMMAAAGIPDVTVIENAAKEPEIVNLAGFLTALGVKVRGVGTDIIRIEGVKERGGARCSVIPDRIEAGTYMIAAGITGGEVTLENVIITHLHPVIAKLEEAGLRIVPGEDNLTVASSGELKATDIKTLPYPGFPTDLQSPMMALLSVAKGTSTIVENVFENRFQVADELKRMGAQIKVKGQTAIVEGVERLYGAQVKATDLRAGAALIVAGLAAEGETEICHGELIARGYEKIEKKLQELGACIRVI